MRIPFTKMHALGNDFMILDGVQHALDFSAADIIQWSHRHRGVGFDQCLIVEPSLDSNIDFFYRIFNANGTEVGQCGNGARCLARFIQAKKLSSQSVLRIATLTTRMTLTLHDDETVSVDMGTPCTAPSAIPLQTASYADTYILTFNTHPTCQVHALSVGNPHAILSVNDLDQVPVATLGQAISVHPFFPQQTNVEFMQIISPSCIRLRVYERGCGETQACGSGAVAAVAAGQLFYQLQETVTVQLPGGELTVTKHLETGALSLRGPATFVYDGVLY